MLPRGNRSLATLLVLLCFAAYASSLRNQYIWDDDDYVTGNKTLRSVQGLTQIWFEPSSTPQYYPLVFTTFWVEYQLWGRSPAGYHFVNIALHATNACLLWWLLRRLSVPGSWFCAALFAVHPVHVESVAWITERKNVLSGLFYLSAFHSLLTMTIRRQAGAPLGQWWGDYAIAMMLYVAALLSKTVTCTLPAAFLVVEYFRTGRVSPRLVGLMAPFFIVGIAMGLNTARLESAHVGATGPEFAWSIAQRVQIASGAICHYAWTLLCPVNLMFFYPKWELDATKAINWLPTALVLTILAVSVLQQHRLGRGQLAALLFFMGTLFPALGFINVYPMRYSFVADHFQYLASIGVITLAGSLLWQSALRLGTVPAVTLAASVILGLGILSAQQCGIYYNEETLWIDTLKKNPGSAIANTHFGRILVGKDQAPLAVEYFRRSLAAQPENNPEPIYNIYVLEAHQLMLSGRYAEAESQCRKALEVRLSRASFAESELGAIMMLQQRTDEAISWFQRAVELTPENGRCRLQLAVAYAAAGRVALARKEAEMALLLIPDWDIAKQFVSQLREQGD